MSYETLLVERHERYMAITLNRPDVLNSFNEKMHAELRGAVALAAEDNSVRCLLLTGAGRGFCAGQDLGDRSTETDNDLPDLGESLENNYNPLIRQITGMHKPVICAVNGVAAGAGANLALSCDIVLAARSASFIQAFCKIGLVPDSGGTWFLPRLIGEARARALALLGDKVPAEQAESWGMIWRCVDNDALQSESHELAERLATGPTLGLGLIKRALLASPDNSLDQQLDLERDLQSTAGRSADFREGVDAFTAKRSPKFRGE